MKTHLRAFILLCAFAIAGSLTGCPRNVFTVRIINDADTARVISLLLDDTGTMGSDSVDLLDQVIDPGESGRIVIDIADAEAVNANAVIVGCIEGSGISEIIDGTVPVAFAAGGEITVTVTGTGEMLVFDF
ncbi:MAG: hypothetical protein SGI88_17675 [Candidatus Hydrogenedentes bacterium]|nr:hypothetical protein [Candidatus Hydrogenedentota bacterium]